MAKLRVADFYYGAAISFLFNKGLAPVLVEAGENRQVYEITADDTEFRLYMKYRKTSRLGTDGYRSWTFSLTDNEVNELKDYLAQNLHLSMHLICVEEELSSSELVVIHGEEIQQLLDGGKTSITVSIKPRERAYRISIGGDRDNAIRVPTSRYY